MHLPSSCGFSSRLCVLSQRCLLFPRHTISSCSGSQPWVAAPSSVKQPFDIDHPRPPENTDIYIMMYNSKTITINSNKNYFTAGRHQDMRTSIKGCSGRKADNHCSNIMFGFSLKYCSSLPHFVSLDFTPFGMGEGGQAQATQPGSPFTDVNSCSAWSCPAVWSQENSLNDKWGDGCFCSQQRWFHRQEKCPSNDKVQDNDPVCLGEAHTPGPHRGIRAWVVQTH